MKYKFSTFLCFLLVYTIFVGIYELKAQDSDSVSIQSMLSKVQYLNISDSDFSAKENINLNLRFVDSLDCYTLSKNNFIAGIDSLKKEIVFIRYFLDKTKYFDSIVRYINSISDYEILTDEQDCYIWKNKEDVYFVLQMSKDTCIFTELVMGYFLKYYAKYLE